MFKPQPPEFPSTTALVAKSLLPVTEEEKAKQPEGSLLMSEELKNILRSLKQYFLERHLIACRLGYLDMAKTRISRH